MARDKYAKVRALHDEVASLIADIHRQWWRPLRNRRRRGKVRRLLAESAAELEAIDRRAAEFRDAAARLKGVSDGRP